MIGPTIFYLDLLFYSWFIHLSLFNKVCASSQVLLTRVGFLDLGSLKRTNCIAL